MNLTDIAHDIPRLLRACAELHRMPRAQLEFNCSLNPEHIRATHQNFTKRHPRFRVIRNKTVGIALIDLRKFKTPEDYLDTVKKKDLAGYQARRASARGYQVGRINRNLFIDDIHAINNSSEVRQGRPMDDAYRIKETRFDDLPHYAYFGTTDNADKLVGYCNLAFLGNFAATERVIGNKNSDGSMYLLLTEIICSLIEQKTVNYLMYDSYLGAQPGLRNFKHKLGFRPYLVRYLLA